MAARIDQRPAARNGPAKAAIRDTRGAIRSFCIAATPAGTEVVVALTGDLDLAYADELERALRKLRYAGFECVVLDLRGVEFIDSTGLRLLITQRNAARREGHCLILVPGPRQVQRIFDLTGTRGLFSWRDPRA